MKKNQVNRTNSGTHIGRWVKHDDQWAVRIVFDPTAPPTSEVWVEKANGDRSKVKLGERLTEPERTGVAMNEAAIWSVAK